ncbi:DMT family transporter [Erythrobacter sp. HA6-11]
MTRNPALLPLLATIVGIGFFSAMDAVMKSAAIAIGAYSAYFLRCAIGVSFAMPIWALTNLRRPAREVLRIHIIRGVVAAFMGLSFFYAIVRLPLAEAIALSFIAPLIALYLAAILLDETIERKAIIAAILGLLGVVIIVGGKIGRERMTEDAALGLAALFLSAVLYAWNLILQRQQALVASPIEVSVFQNGIAGSVLLIGTPFLLVIPQDQSVWIDLVSGAVLTILAVLFLSWAYARAEAQVLVPIEYTGFLWAALFGWLMFDESVTPATVAGAALIVIGCWIATRQTPPEQTSI